MKVVSIVGTRPQLIKAAALQPALRARHDEVFVDTGQHWDTAMAGSFFEELGLIRPDHTLHSGGGTHAQQTAAMLVGLEPILEAERPDAVLVFGDTNSTLAGALVAAKLGFPVAHVEAGLRSMDRSMPEELNRVVTDHLSTWLLAPTEAAVNRLRAEGIVAGVTLVGDVMQDLAARVSTEIRDAAVLDSIAAGLGVPLSPGGYLFATVHRQENRERSAISTWSALLGAVATPARPVVLALHPGTRVAVRRERVSLSPHIHVVEPQSYRTSLALQLHAAAVLTDSGGVQREASWLGVPCLVLRSSSEWPELSALPGGTTRLVGLDVELATRSLADLAPTHGSAEQARLRATSGRIAPAGAVTAILDALARNP